MGANEGDRATTPRPGSHPHGTHKGCRYITGCPAPPPRTPARGVPTTVEQARAGQAQKLLDVAKDHIRITVLPGSGGATAGAAIGSEHYCADQASYTHFSLESLVESRDILDWVNFLHHHRP